MEELKTRSFRVSEEVSSKLKELCEHFDNQNSALSALLNAYEVQNAKAILTDRETDIADYDTHIQAIQSAFLRSLELNENAEKRIKTEFINLLNSKDQTIVQLQTEKAKADEQVEKYKSAYGNLITSTEEKIQAMQTQVSESEKTLQSERERASTEQKAREQAETISAMLSEQVEQLKKQVSDLTEKAYQADEFYNQLTKLQSAYSEKEKELANAEIAKETAVKYAIADTAGKYQRKIDEMQLKIDDMQTKQAEQLATLFQIRGKEMKSMTYSEIKAKISSYAEVVNKSIDEKDEDSMTSYIYGIIEGLKWANVITDIEGQCEELQEIVREILNLPEPEPLHDEEPLTEEEFEELMKSEKFRATFNLD